MACADAFHELPSRARGFQQDLCQPAWERCPPPSSDTQGPSDEGAETPATPEPEPDSLLSQGPPQSRCLSGVVRLPDDPRPLKTRGWGTLPLHNTDQSLFGFSMRQYAKPVSTPSQRQRWPPRGALRVGSHLYFLWGLHWHASPLRSKTHRKPVFSKQFHTEPFTHTTDTRAGLATSVGCPRDVPTML